MDLLGTIIIAVCGVILVEWIIDLFSFSEKSVLITLSILWIVGGLFRVYIPAIIIGIIMLVITLAIYAGDGKKESELLKKIKGIKKKINWEMLGSIALIVVIAIVHELTK